MKPKVELKIIDPRIGTEFPMMRYATDGAAAIDVMAMEDFSIRPGQQAIIPLGFAMHILDEGIAAMLLPRSGLGAKGLVLGNLVGLIDSDYQGEVLAVVWNRNTPPDNPLCSLVDGIAIKAGERIAQMVFVPVIKPEFEIVDEFTESTARGDGAFGHTGK